MHWLCDALLLLILSLAVTADFMTGKIPNYVIAAGLPAGWLCSTIERGIPGLNDGLAGSFLPLAVLMILYVCAMLGAGDIKLLMVCGAFLGFGGSLATMIFSFGIGAVISLTLMIKNRILIHRLKFFSNYITHLLHERKIMTYYDLKRPKKGETFHFSICIFLAAGGLLLF